MGCPDRDCCTSGVPGSRISFPNTFDHNTPWKFYNHLIAGIPEGIRVIDYCLGAHWSYVQAECGTGVAFTTSGGAKRTYTVDLRGLELREVAELSKSWCFEEASLGVAALNAWYARAELLDPLGATYDESVTLADGTVAHKGWAGPRADEDAAKPEPKLTDELIPAPVYGEFVASNGASGVVRKIDAFELYRDEIASRKDTHVTVVGHFPHVERIQEFAQLTVLERKCANELDTPDPACEYVLPSTDYAFITGVTIIIKTLPRLLDLTKNATTVLMGPSVVMSPFLFDWGVEMLAGSIVADPEKAKFAVKNGAGKIFNEALRMTRLKCCE